MRAFQVKGNSWPCSFCCQIHLRNQKILLAASVLPLLFHHFKRIPSILKYEVILISIITWTENVDLFQCLYKIFTFWNLSLLRDEKHLILEASIDRKCSGSKKHHSLLGTWDSFSQNSHILLFGIFIIRNASTLLSHSCSLEAYL